MSKLYFFRHAQASFLADNYDQLSPHGEKQSVELGKYLVEKKIRFDKIFVGPLKRQQHTYEIVADVYSKNNLTIPEAVMLDGLKEHGGTGAMKVVYPKLISEVPSLKKLAEDIASNPKLKKRNTLLIFQYFMDEWAEGNIEVPDHLSWAGWREGVKNALGHILEATGKGETIGTFTSGGTISSITAESLQIGSQKKVAAMNFSIRNTSFTSFLFSRKQFNLLSFNELPHLEKEMVTFV